MKKLSLLIFSVIALFFGSVRTAQASETLNFNLETAEVAAVTPVVESTPPATPVKPTIEVNFAPPPAVDAAPVDAGQTEDPLTAIAVAPPEMPASQVAHPSVAIAADSANPTHTEPADTETIFAGGSDSLVARTVGHAEGTRTADGQRTRAYYGHVDPGNGVWNLGSFSYQHCDSGCSPEEADQRQLQRLRNQTDVLKTKAEQNHLRMSLEEKLNAIDLANQAPLAALDQGGYIDRLKQAYAEGLSGSDAVLWARTHSFINPRTQTWDAPGLGNTYERISHDQERRRQAIARALEVHQQQETQVEIARSAASERSFSATETEPSASQPQASAGMGAGNLNL